MKRSNYIYLLALFLCAGCASLKTVQPRIDDVPHIRDKYSNLWINLADSNTEPQKIIPAVLGYLANKKDLEGCFVRVPYDKTKYINYLKSQKFEPYRLNANETVWIYRNGRGIPDQSNTLADARVALFNHKKQMLLIRDRGGKVWTLPGGGVNAKELIKTAAVREVKEEVGKNIEESGLELVAVANLIFNISDQATNIIQHFYVYSKPIENNIILDPSEVDDYAWINLDSINHTYTYKNFPVNKKIVDLISQFRQRTSKRLSKTYSEIPMNIDMFKW